jgi:hypothetical protein
MIEPLANVGKLCQGGSPLPLVLRIMELGVNCRQVHGYRRLRGKVFRNKDLTAILLEAALGTDNPSRIFFLISTFGISNLGGIPRKIFELKGLIAKIFINHDLAFSG